MTLAIIILSVFLILSLYKWFKWKVTALAAMYFAIDKYREMTDKEMDYYVNTVIKKMLHIKN